MPYQRQTVELIAQSLIDAGVTVEFVPGWETRGSRYFNPKLHTNHHDASRSGSARSLIVHGRSDVPGPLSHFYIERDGVLAVIAAGRANHAGRGGYKGYTGNSSAWGTEIANNGIGETYGTDQLYTIMSLNAVLNEVANIEIEMLHAHFEWAPKRKIDPSGPPRSRSDSDLRWDMTKLRHDVDKWEVLGMPTAEEVARAVWRHDVHGTPAANRLNNADVRTHQIKSAQARFDERVAEVQSMVTSRDFERDTRVVRESLRAMAKKLGLKVTHDNHVPDEVEA